MPTGIAKLEDMEQVVRQHLDEVAQPLRIATPSGRQLVEDRSVMRAQQPDARENIVQWLIRVRELFVVCQEPACLDGIKKAGRSLSLPVPEGFGRGESIETIIDLNSIEITLVIVKPLPRRQLFRVKDMSPMLVHPARGANPDLTGFGHAFIPTSTR